MCATCALTARVREFNFQSASTSRHQREGGPCSDRGGGGAACDLQYRRRSAPASGYGLRRYAFQPLLGPKDKRVLLLSNAKLNVEREPFKLALFTGNYKEQVTWCDAATGRIIAASDFFEPLTAGSLITPGFGGRVYFPTGKGFMALQVVPAVASPAGKFLAA